LSVTYALKLPCGAAGPGVLSEAGFRDAFGCDEKNQWAVSPYGAVNKHFRETVLHEKGTGACSGALEAELECANRICIVPSNPSCSPGLFANAPSPYEDVVAKLAPLPNAAEQWLESRVFVVPDWVARDERVTDYDPWRSRPDSYFTPPWSTIEAIEAKLPSALAASCDERGAAIAKRLKGYMGQYAGWFARAAAASSATTPAKR
jgi:hypothetical protein